MKNYFKSGEEGFTLFQLIALIVVLGLLATTAVQVVYMLIPSTWEGEARSEMEKIRCAIVGCVDNDCGYMGDNGLLPVNLIDLLEDPGDVCNWEGPYLDIAFVDAPTDYLYDPWGNLYIWDPVALTLTSTGGGEIDPIVINVANSINDLLSKSVQYSYIGADGSPLDDTDIEVYVDYGCGNIQLNYNTTGGYFYGSGLPQCGLEVMVIPISGEAVGDTLYPSSFSTPDDPVIITCEWGNITYVANSEQKFGDYNEKLSFDINVSGNCAFDVTSIALQWSGSTWCDEQPYLESFIVGGTEYWNYITDNNGVRIQSGQEMILRNTLTIYTDSVQSVTEMKFADSPTDPAYPIQLDGTDMLLRMFSSLAPTQLIAFQVSGTPPATPSLYLESGSVTTSGSSDEDVSFGIVNPAECCLTFTEMIVEWDTTCSVSYLETIKVDGVSLWSNSQCRLVSGQYISLDEQFSICEETLTIDLLDFNYDRGSSWGDDYSTPDGGDHSISGVIQLDPNNNSDFEFYLVKSDGSLITIGDLDSSMADYSGTATWVHVRPRGGGTQDSLTLDGSTYVIYNDYSYDIEDNSLTVNLRNDQRDGSNNAIGDWYITITGSSVNFFVNAYGYYDGDIAGSGHGGGGSCEHRYGCSGSSGSGHSGSGHGGSGHGGSGHSGSGGGSGYSPPDCPDSDGDGKITICHYPPGNPANVQVLCIATEAWEAHKAHGDDCGNCTSEDVYECSLDKDYYKESSKKADMDGHHFKITLVTPEGDEYEIEFDTESASSPLIERYGTNLTVGGSGGGSEIEFTIRNNGGSMVEIEKIMIVWDNPNAYMSEFELEDRDYWDADDGNIRLSSGGIIDLDYHYYLGPGETADVELDHFKDSASYGSGSYVNMECTSFEVTFIGVGDNCVYTISFTTPGCDGGGGHDGGHNGGHG